MDIKESVRNILSGILEISTEQANDIGVDVYKRQLIWHNPIRRNNYHFISRIYSAIHQKV